MRTKVALEAVCKGPVRVIETDQDVVVGRKKFPPKEAKVRVPLLISRLMKEQVILL
jgi:hypothetical protein